MSDSTTEDLAGARPNASWTDELDQAIEAFASGESTVILIESDDGSAVRLLEGLPDSIDIYSRVVAAPATRARVAAIADELNLDEFEGGAGIVLEEAQWADPTSLGRLQRMVHEEAHHTLLVVAHRPLSEVDGWWFTRLADDARKHAHLLEVAAPPRDESGPEPDLDTRSVDLIVATQLVTGPISVSVAARLLDASEGEVLELGESLSKQGWIRQERGGFRCLADMSASVAGDVRIGYVAGKLADVMEGQSEPASVVGSLRLAAGRPAEAFPLLFEAATEAENRHATGEAYHLAADSLRAAEEAGITDDDRLGALHLICGRFLRSAGRTSWARAHLERATGYLEGEARVDAFGFAAAVADDSQHPQEAERLIAIGEWEAERIGERAKVGSLWTFRALVLNRIGFADEADSVLAKGRALLDEGSSPYQRFNASRNKAWIHFDRGEAKLAEAEFTHLRDEAGALEGDVGVADKEAWRARSLFASGHPAEALEAIGVVEEISAREGVEAPLFLSQLALTDGNFTYGRYEEALAASERVLDLVQRQLPAWENMARSNRAHALLGLGRLDEAREEIQKAIAASPGGADGWRWRIRCQALEMEIAVESGERWDARAAEDLADLMLQSRFYHWAADLLCAIAKYGKRKSAAAEAMAIAVKVGRPMTAARAASIGGLWGEPAAAQAISGIRAIAAEVPRDWEDEWKALPWVAEALAAPEPTEDVETEAATAALEEALRKAGLAGDEVLSPAQRRSRGLVRRPRVLRPIQMVAAALAVVVLAGGTAFAVVAANTDEPTPATTAPPVVEQTTIPEPLSLEETQVNQAIDIVAGTALHRGGSERTAFFDVEGPREVDGFYWKFQADSPIEAGPVAIGSNLIVASRDGTIYAINMTSGELAYPAESPEGRIFAAPALGQGNFGEGPLRPMMVIGDDAGVVRAYISDSGEQQWRTELPDTRVLSSPVIVESIAFVATTRGFIHSFSLTGNGEILGTYPAEGEGLGRIDADLAYSNGFLYVGTDDGLLHVLSVSGDQLEEVCTASVGSAITVPPVVSGDVVYVPTEGQQVLTYRAGTCDSPAPDRELFIFAEAPMDEAAAVADGGSEAQEVLYTAAGRFLNSRKVSVQENQGLTGNDLYLWAPSEVSGELKITGDPVITVDTAYFGDQEGNLHAVDRFSGEVLWTWRTGVGITAPPAVVDGVLFIAGGDGTITAVGTGEPLEDRG
jgi:outer membrane protein assembly factor BamB/tetratricopeptide (TPR) repeat protein